MHMLLDLRGNIPTSFTSRRQAARRSRSRLVIPEAGAIYVMDRGYIDFARLYVLQQAGAFFVTRAKSNLDAHRVYSARTDRATGIIADQTIALDGYSTSKDIRFICAASDSRMPHREKGWCLTNHFTLPPALICDLYKSRWQVELFFKWIKQRLRIKQFYGTSDNAVRTQIWIAVSVYVLVAIVKKRPRLGGLSLHFAPGFLGHPLRNADVPGIFRKHNHFRRRRTQRPAQSVRLLTGQSCREFKKSGLSQADLGRRLDKEPANYLVY